MANEIHRKKLVANTDMGFGTSYANIDSLADGDLTWSDPVTNAGTCDEVHVYASIKVGTTPTAGSSIDFYAGYGDDDTSEIRSGTDDITTTATGTETVDADVARVLGTLDWLGSVIVDATTDKVYGKRLIIESPGDDFNVYVYNNTGAAFNGTASPHKVHYIGWGPEVQ